MAVTINSVKAWVLASRPKTLGAIICPILIGNALALYHHRFSLTVLIMTLINGVLLQILANVVNDYGDFIKGSDKADRLGPPRAMQMGWITKAAMLRGIAVLLVMSVGLGLFLVVEGGLIIFVIGVIAILLCLAYTLGPVPLAYFGFAELVIFVVFGPMTVLGSYFVQAKILGGSALVASMSSGFLAAALLLTNNLRDVVQDKNNNKRTIAVRFGEPLARRLVIVLVVCALIGPVALVVQFAYPPTLLLACFALIFPMRHFVMIATTPVSAQFNLMLAAIGKALYLFGILFFVGLSYGAI